MARAHNGSDHDFAGGPISARATAPDLAASVHFSNSPERDRPLFDQRPGELEATRGISSIPVVYGHRTNTGRGNKGSWQVVLARRGEVLIELTADEARGIAFALQAYADVCDEGNAA